MYRWLWYRIKESDEMKKVLLIFPPFTQPDTAKKRCLVPMGIAYIAGYLRKHGVDVEVYDSVVEGYETERYHKGMMTFGSNDDTIKNVIKKSNPDIVGVSCLMTQQKHNALRVLNIAKSVNSHIKTVMGGCHPSVLPNESLSYDSVDSVAIGEGEASMLSIVNGKSGVVRSSPLDVDTIPFPARDLFSMEKYFKINMPENPFSPNKRVTQLVTSRGCPFRCYFCSTVRFHGSWRGRKAQSVIDESKHLVNSYGVDELNILDENFVVKRSRVIEILKGIKHLDVSVSNPGGVWIQGLDNELLEYMKDAGFYQLVFPIESSNPKILKDVIHKPLEIEIVEPLVKHCRKIGIDTHGFFICGFPQQTREDMQNDFEYAKKIGLDSASFNLLSPFPGSDLYYDYRDKIDTDDANYIKATIPHPTIPKEELEDMVNSFNVNFNKSLKWRRPIKYISKYYGTALRKHLDIKTITKRQ